MDAQPHLGKYEGQSMNNLIGPSLLNGKLEFIDKIVRSLSMFHLPASR